MFSGTESPRSVNADTPVYLSPRLVQHFIPAEVCPAHCRKGPISLPAIYTCRNTSELRPCQDCTNFSLERDKGTPCCDGMIAALVLKLPAKLTLKASRLIRKTDGQRKDCVGYCYISRNRINTRPGMRDEGKIFIFLCLFPFFLYFPFCFSASKTSSSTGVLSGTQA